MQAAETAAYGKGLRSATNRREDILSIGKEIANNSGKVMTGRAAALAQIGGQVRFPVRCRRFKKIRSRHLGFRGRARGKRFVCLHAADPARAGPVLKLAMRIVPAVPTTAAKAKPHGAPKTVHNSPTTMLETKSPIPLTTPSTP